MENFDPIELLKKTSDLNELKELSNKFLYEKTILGIDIYRYRISHTYR